MNISINNQVMEVEVGSLLSQLVFQQIGENQKGIAVAVNGEVKPKSSWAEFQLNQNDEVLIIKATQGG